MLFELTKKIWAQVGSPTLWKTTLVAFTLVWFGLVFWIYVDLAVFQPYLDLEAGDNQSLKIQVARPGIEPRSSCSASQELNHSATAAPFTLVIPYLTVQCLFTVKHTRENNLLIIERKVWIKLIATVMTVAVK